MIKFYSKQTNGFYDKEIHGENIPNDAVEISNSKYDELLQEQVTGGIIAGNEQGLPYIKKPVVIESTYKEKRAQAYPSIADQLDLIYHEGVDAWKAQIAAVKQAYPKP